MSDKATRHYPHDYLDSDGLEELRAPYPSDEDFNRLSPEVKNLLSGRRRLGVTWLDDYEIVAEVIRNEGCGCSVKPGQIAVFDMRHRIKPEKSDMPLCMHLLSPVLAVFYMDPTSSLKCNIRPASQ